MKFWLIKSEPFKYSWAQFEKDQQTFWDGVRNYQARNNLQAMNVGDKCLFYHSNEGNKYEQHCTNVYGKFKTLTCTIRDCIKDVFSDFFFQ